MSTKEISLSEPLSLNGARVLLVEDEFYIADDVRPVLECAGPRTVRPCSTFRQAEAALDENAFDCAVIDRHLQGSAASIAASPLRSPPDMEAAPDRLSHMPRIEKPFDPAALAQVVAQLSGANAD